MLQYDQYFNEYKHFVGTHCVGNIFLLDTKSIYQGKNFHILKYQHQNHDSLICQANQSILVVPSIFNSPEILALSKNSSLIEGLSGLADVYLINWLEITDKDHSLNQYVLSVTEALRLLTNITKKPVNLLGHCIGGNLALAASLITPLAVSSLSLLTTPWDFSHFSLPYYIQRFLDLDKNIESLECVPKIYIQILFFLLSPECFNRKLKNYMSLDSIEDKQFFFRIEHWLMSGYDLPSATYFQITRQFLQENSLLNLAWKVDNTIIDPINIDVPVSLVIANEDKIAPKYSINPLCQRLKYPTIINVDGGHIGYLIGDKLNQFLYQYQLWFRRNTVREKCKL